MADVFISYKREDVAIVEQMVACLQQQGLSVWYDASMQAGETFTDVIQRELKAAKCVLVLWSSRSVGSRWVNAEAHHGLEHQRLVSCKIETCNPPPPFNIIHHSDLTRWQGDCEDFHWVLVRDAVQVIVGGVSTQASSSQLQAARDAGLIDWGVEQEFDEITILSREAYSLLLKEGFPIILGPLPYKDFSREFRKDYIKLHEMQENVRQIKINVFYLFIILVAFVYLDFSFSGLSPHSEIIVVFMILWTFLTLAFGRAAYSLYYRVSKSDGGSSKFYDFLKIKYGRAAEYLKKPI